MTSRIFGRVPFAMVPEWIVDHPELSDRAVRLWAILHRYATAEGGEAPGRATLAKRCGGCSTDSIDRAKKELVKVGALRVIRRGRSDRGDFETNDYELIHENPCAGSRTGAARGGRVRAATGSSTTAAKGGRKAAAQLHRDSREVETPPPDGAAGDDVAARAHALVVAHWERCQAEGRPKPVLRAERGRGGKDKAFVALRGIVVQLLEAEWPDDEVAAALWDTSGGHTLQGLGVQLTKARARAQHRDGPPPSEIGQRGTPVESIADPGCQVCGGSGWAAVDEHGQVIDFDSPRIVDEPTTSKRCDCVHQEDQP